MKPHRGALICLWALITAGLLGGAGMFWISWPVQTSRDFVTAVADGRCDRVATGDKWVLLTSGPCGLERSGFDESAVELERRGMADYLVGRQRFFVTGVPYDFQAERGMVTLVNLSVTVLIDKARAYLKDGLFAEAEAVARLACDEDPDSLAAMACLFRAKIERQLEHQRKLSEERVTQNPGCFMCY